MTRLVGREPELTVALDLLERAARGAGGALAVIGEPGAGKSSFLHELQARADAFGTLRARGVAAEAVLPFAGLHQLVYARRDLLDRLPEPQARALEAAMGLGGNGGKATDRYLVALATLSMLTEVAVERPLLVLIDDLPWLDAASREAILFASRRLASEPIVVILASRSEDWPQVGDPDVPTVELAPLDTDGVATLLATGGTAVPSADVARRVAAMTAGNPLAIIEFAAELTADQLAGRTALPAHLPLTRGLERTFASRVAGLDLRSQRAAMVVAADDTGRREVVVSALTSLGLDAGDLERAIGSGLVVDRDGTLDLRHPLIRSAAYARARLEEQQAAHLALAAALAADDPDRTTWHRAAAARERDGGLASALRELAERARARGAPEEAMRAWNRAAELEPDVSLATDALLAAASAAWAAGRLESARRIVDNLDRDRLNVIQAAEAGWIRGGIELAAGDPLRAYRTLVQAADRVRATHPERALLMLNVAAEAGSLANDRTATASLGHHAPDLQPDASPAVRLLHAALLGFAADFAGDLDAAVASLRQAVRLASAVDDPTLHVIAGRAAIYSGDDEAARRLHLGVVEEARRRGAVDLVPLAAPRQATAELLLGRWPSAAATAAESSRIADETGQPLLAPHGRATLALLAAMRGDGAAMASHLDQALAGVRDRPMGLIEDDAHWARGILALGSGEHAVALAHLERITHPVVQLLGSLDRTEAAAACDDGRLEAWAAPVLALATDDGPAWANARVHYARALVAKSPERAWMSFERALEASQASGRPFERARVQLAAGSHLRRHRHRVEARRHLRAAAATFELLGATPWTKRAHAELRASGETAMRAASPSVERLTPQELQVARAVADGFSNKDVAARLFLSPRTVEFHLRNVFAKLDITSRAQLARISLEDPAALAETR